MKEFFLLSIYTIYASPKLMPKRKKKLPFRHRHRIHMHYACFSLCHKIFFRIAMLLTTYLLKVCTLFRHGPFDPSITLEFLVERSTHSHIEGSNFSFGFGRLWLGQNPPFRKSKEFGERTAFPYTSLYIRIENTLSYLPLNYLYC